MNKFAPGLPRLRTAPARVTAGHAAVRTAALVSAMVLGGCGQRNQDRLDAGPKASLHARAARASPAQRCASDSAYELVKRELFRRAARTRGEDDPTFEPVVAGSTLTINNAAVQSSDEQLGSVTCTARASLALPQGIYAAGGRSSLAAYIVYVLQPAADQSGQVATLKDADGITIPLATIAGGPATGSQRGSTPVAAMPEGRQASVATGPASGPAAVPRTPSPQVARAPLPSPGPTPIEPRRPRPYQPPPPPRTVSGDDAGWRLARVIDQGPLNTRIYLDRQTSRPTSDGQIRIRTRYVGTVRGRAPVQTITDETIDCRNGDHMQHSYIVETADGRVVTRRGAQSRKPISSGSMLNGLARMVCQ